MRTALVATLLALPTLCMGQSWTVSPFSQATIMGVSMSDDKHGYISGGDNGVGANVLKTSDGCQTFTSIPIHEPALMLMSITSQSPTQAVVTGMGLLSGATQYTTTGTQFLNSSEPKVSLQQTLDVAPVVGTNGNGFVVSGSFSFFGSNETINGVSYSNDGGATFNFADMGTPAEVPARYGAFPSPSVGYVASGTWPSSGSSAHTARKAGHAIHRSVSRNIELISGMHSERSGKRNHHAIAHRINFNNKHAMRDEEYDSGWAAAISKSVDGFQTWETVFTNESYYMNQISCPSVNVCYAAAENDDFGFGLMTVDGGESWQEVLVAAGVSMMSAQAVSDTEAWFGGGILTPPANINGTLFHTTNGGQTFETTFLDGMYLMDLDMVDSTHGFAAALGADSQGNVLIYA